MEKNEHIYSLLKNNFFDREIFTSLNFLMRNISDHLFSPTTRNLCTRNHLLKLHNYENPNALTFIMQYQEIIFYFLTAFLVFFSTWIFNRLILKNRIVTGILEFITCYLIILPSLPFIIIFYAVIAVARGLIWMYFKAFYPGKKFLANPVDSFWFYEKQNSSSASVGLYIIEGKCDFAKIRARLHSVVVSDLVGDKMQRRCITFFGFTCWEKVDNINIDDHVKMVLNSNPKKATTEAELFNFMKQFQDYPIQNKSPWETLIVPNFAYKNMQGKQGKSYYAVIFRLHHGIMDGISSGNILHSIMADKPFKFSVDPIEPLVKMSKITECLMYIIALINLPRSGLMNLLMLDNKNNKYFAPGPKLIGSKSFAWSRPIRMEALKKLKNDTKTSVFSVLMSSFGGSYRKVLAGKGQAPTSEFVHSICPVALLPYPDRKPRNGFSGFLCPISVQCISPGERLNIMYQMVKKLTSSSIVILGNYYLILMFGLMPAFMHRHFSYLIHVKMTLSNIPGPAEPVKIFDGDTIVDIGTWLPIKLTVGLGMGLFSYADRLRATVIADKVSLSEDADVDLIASEFENELALLAKSSGIEEKELFII